MPRVCDASLVEALCAENQRLQAELEKASDKMQQLGRGQKPESLGQAPKYSESGLQNLSEVVRLAGERYATLQDLCRLEASQGKQVEDALRAELTERFQDRDVAPASESGLDRLSDAVSRAGERHFSLEDSVARLQDRCLSEEAQNKKTAKGS